MRNLLLIFILVLTGCTTQRFIHDPSEVTAHLAAHPDRPDRIKYSLSAGKLEHGMNEDEVQLCWGKPDKVTTEHSSEGTRKSWAYTEPRMVASSEYWTIFKNMIVREAVFIDGRLSEWKVIEDNL